MVTGNVYSIKEYRHTVFNNNYWSGKQSWFLAQNPSSIIVGQEACGHIDNHNKWYNTTKQK